MNRNNLFSLVAVIAAMLIIGGCSENVPPVAPGGEPYDGPPSEYEGPVVAPAITVLDGITPSQGFEYIGNTFIAGDTTQWDALRFTSLPQTLEVRAGHWCNEALLRDGKLLFGSYAFAGTIPGRLYQIENEGVYASHMNLVDDQGPWIWQWPSNLDSLITLNIEIPNNWSHAARLGVVGTATCFSTFAAELTNDNGVYRLALPTWKGDQKIAVVDMATGRGVDDSVTVRINGAEMEHYVTDFVHPRWPGVLRYYRFNVGPTGSVVSQGEEDRWTYDNVVQVVSNLPGAGDMVILQAEGLTTDRPMEMTKIGPNIWEVSGLSSWVGLQDLRVYTASGTPIYYGVLVNGQELHHLVTVPLEPNPPLQLFRFYLNHDHTVAQGDDNRTIVIDIGN